MSLNHRKQSLIFSTPSTTSQKLKIQSIIDVYKHKFKISERSISSNQQNIPHKLSLAQAKQLENLHQYTVNREIDKCTRDPSRARNLLHGEAPMRKPSLHRLLESYDRNCYENTAEPENTIEQHKMQIFRSGVHYRSVERARGVGVKPLEKQSLLDYYNCDDNPEYDRSNTKSCLETAKSHQTSNTRCQYSRLTDSKGRYNLSARRWSLRAF